MSAKTGPQQERRTSLSLNAAKQQQQSPPQQQQQVKASQGQQSTSIPVAKHDNKTNTRHEPTLAELRDAQRQLANQEKKQPNKVEAVKKSQNGVGKTKEKPQPQQQQQSQLQQQQNGNGAANEKKEKPEKVERTTKQQSKDENEKKMQPNPLDKETKQKKIDIEAASEEKKQNKNVLEKSAEKQSEAKVVLTVNSPSLSSNKKQSGSTSSKADKEKSATTSNIVVPIDADAKPLTTLTKVSVAVEKLPTPVETPTKPQTEINLEDDIDMEDSLVSETSPNKKQFGSGLLHKPIENIIPAATSTPGKVSMLMSKIAAVAAATKSDSKPSSGISPHRNYLQISGRRSIRSTNDYMPSHLQNNLNFRESYRRINTELDVSSTTNTSLNVTVGSEVPNNSSFSFFGRGRKRERTPPESISALGVQTDAELSPPKRARMDVYGFLSAVASPLTLLRSRFAKASIHNSSTPVKLAFNIEEYETDVQNVSGISIEEEIPSGDDQQIKDLENITVGKEAGLEAPAKCSPEKVVTIEKPAEDNEKCISETATTSGVTIENGENDDIKITETHLVGADGDPLSKNRRCIVM